MIEKGQSSWVEAGMTRILLLPVNGISGTRRVQNYKPALLDNISNHINEPGIYQARLEIFENCSFRDNIRPSTEEDKESGYIVMGRG